MIDRLERIAGNLEKTLPVLIVVQKWIQKTDQNGNAPFSSRTQDVRMVLEAQIKELRRLQSHER